MKIYISGKLTGSETDDFNRVESFLNELGYDVVNPAREYVPDEPDSVRFGRRMQLLWECDAIYLMDNWKDTTESKCERDSAREKGLVVYHETNINETCERRVKEIQDAIYQVTGMKFKEYVTKSRKRDGFYARMIFVYHCRKLHLTLTQIAKYVHRDHTTMLHLLNKYQDDMRYNPDFRYVATKVNEILNDKDI